MSRWLVALGMVLSMGVLGLQDVVLACTCAQPASVQEGLQQADAVFAGLVERFELKGSGRVATFRVRRVWEGPKTQRIQVATGGGDGDCGYHFIVGMEYLVFARRGASDTLQTSICSRTKQASGEAVDDLKALGPGTPITGRYDH
jgi:hypothetical protein